MKVFNKNLEPTQNQALQDRITSILQKNIDFLVENYGIDRSMLMERASKLSIVEAAKKEQTYLYKYNGETREGQIGRNVAAFTGILEQKHTQESVLLDNAIYVGDNNDELEISHELFHFLSMNEEMQFDAEDNATYKTGVIIEKYNREDTDYEPVDDSLSAVGINEGITDMFATQLIGKDARYTYPVHIAQILIGNKDKSLIKSYFSKDPQDFKKFLEEFEKRQDKVTAKQLVQFSKTGFDIDTTFLKGCVEYTLSYCENIEELKAERLRLMSIFKEISKNTNYTFDGIEDFERDEPFDVQGLFNDIMNEKRRELLSKQQEPRINECGEIIRPGNSETGEKTSLPIVEGFSDKCKTIGMSKLAKDIKAQHSEIRTVVAELENPTKTNEQGVSIEE